MPMKKLKVSFVANVKGRLKLVFVSLFFTCFQVENKVVSMYKIFYLHPFTIPHFFKVFIG